MIKKMLAIALSVFMCFGFCIIAVAAENEGYVEAIPFKYDRVSDFHEGMARIIIDNKQGFIDKTGKEVVSPKYDFVGDFSEGLAMVQLGNKYGYIDKTGKEVIPLKEYGDANGFSDGLASVSAYDPNTDNYIDKTGKVILSIENSYGRAGSFVDGLASFYSSVNGKGFIDKTGKLVLDTSNYETNSRIIEDMIRVMSINHNYGFIDKTGKEIVPPKYSDAHDFSEGLAVVNSGSLDYNFNYTEGKYGFIDKTGNVVIPFEYASAQDFSEGWALVSDDSKGAFRTEYFYIDKSGKKVLSVADKLIMSSYSEGLAKFGTLSGDSYAYGFIDKTGEVVVPAKYSEAHNFFEGMAAVQFGGKWGFIAKVDVPKQPAPNAVPTSSTVYLNGEAVSIDAYNIGGNNYFKLRDLAFMLSGTDKQFDVSWDGTLNAMTLLPNSTYTIAGGEMAAGDGTAKNAKLTTSKIMMDGKEMQLTAYNIDGNNYFKLRDIGNTFDFATDWDGVNKAINIDTSKPYSE